MIDYSFLRFKNTLPEAQNIGNPTVAKLNYHFQIQLCPCENYVQISNFDKGISFDGDFKAELIDCNDNVKSLITDSVGIFEFQDVNGINQIALELSCLDYDFGFEPIHLKITHLGGSDIYYSNAFVLTSEKLEETTRFDYKSYGYFNGIDYTNADFYQSIRLNLWFDNVESQTEVSDYYQISTKNTISTRAQYKQLELYKCEYTNRFVYERANIMFIHDVVYADGVRITNKPQLKASERIGYSNLFETSFSCFKNYNDNYLYSFQVIDELQIIDKSPFGYYTLANLPNEISIQFNKDITLNGGYISLYNNDTLITQYDVNDIVLFGGLITIDIAGLINTNGNYKVTIDKGFISKNCEILPYQVWDFTINDGFYDKTFYDINNYS